MVVSTSTHNEHLCNWPIIISLMTWERWTPSAPDRPQIWSFRPEEKDSRWRQNCWHENLIQYGASYGFMVKIVTNARPFCLKQLIFSPTTYIFMESNLGLISRSNRPLKLEFFYITMKNNNTKKIHLKKLFLNLINGNSQSVLSACFLFLIYHLVFLCP